MLWKGRNHHLPRVFLCLAVMFWSLVVRGCGAPALDHALPQNTHTMAPRPKLLAVYMPWFGDHSHADVGYSSHDRSVLKKQIQQARSMGISGFVVDWYGDTHPIPTATSLFCRKLPARLILRSLFFITSRKTKKMTRLPIAR